MVLDETKAPFTAEHKGGKYYFCGAGCKERFERQPEEYLTGEITDWVKDE